MVVDSNGFSVFNNWIIAYFYRIISFSSDNLSTLLNRNEKNMAQMDKNR